MNQVYRIQILILTAAKGFANMKYSNWIPRETLKKVRICINIGPKILTNTIQCRGSLGYCPQFDALDPLLTGREHLRWRKICRNSKYPDRNICYLQALRQTPRLGREFCGQSNKLGPQKTGSGCVCGQVTHQQNVSQWIYFHIFCCSDVRELILVATRGNCQLQ